MKQGTRLRVVRRLSGNARRTVKSTLTEFEQFRRELAHCDAQGAKLVAFHAGRVLRKNWSKAGARIRVVFGAGKGALDSAIRISRDGKEIFTANV